MSEKEAQINVKLAQSTLDEWDRYREEQGFSSRAEFIRFAVNREISGHNDPQQLEEIDTDVGNELADSIETLTGEIHSVQEELETLQNAVRSDPKTDELADTLFSILPDEEPGSSVWQQELNERYDELKAIKEGHADGDIEAVQEQLNAWKATPEALSEALNEPTRKIHVALDKLMTETHLINSKETDEETRYWKEV